MTILSFIGLLGAILGTAALLPQLFKIIREENASGLSAWFLLLWASEKVLCFIYSAGTNATALTFKYGFGIMIISIMCYYKFWRK